MSSNDFSCDKLYEAGNPYVQHKGIVISIGTGNKKANKKPNQKAMGAKKQKVGAKNKKMGAKNAQPTVIRARSDVIKPSILTRSRRRHNRRGNGQYKSKTVRFTRKPLVRSLDDGMR